MSTEPVQDPTPLQMATNEEFLEEMSARCTALVLFGTISRTATGGNMISSSKGDPFTCVGLADILLAMARTDLAHSLKCDDPDCDTCRGKRESEEEA